MKCKHLNDNSINYGELCKGKNSYSISNYDDETIMDEIRYCPFCGKKLGII